MHIDIKNYGQIRIALAVSIWFKFQTFQSLSGQGARLVSPNKYKMDQKPEVSLNYCP